MLLNKTDMTIPADGKPIRLDGPLSPGGSANRLAPDAGRYAELEVRTSFSLSQSLCENHCLPRQARNKHLDWNVKHIPSHLQVTFALPKEPTNFSVMIFADPDGFSRSG